MIIGRPGRPGVRTGLAAIFDRELAIGPAFALEAEIARIAATLNRQNPTT